MTARVMQTIETLRKAIGEAIKEAIQDTTANAYRAPYQLGFFGRTATANGQTCPSLCL